MKFGWNFIEDSSMPPWKEHLSKGLEQVQLFLEPMGTKSHGWDLPKHLSHSPGLSRFLHEYIVLFFKILFSKQRNLPSLSGICYPLHLAETPGDKCSKMPLQFDAVIWISSNFYFKLVINLVRSQRSWTPLFMLHVSQVSLLSDVF